MRTPVRRLVVTVVLTAVVAFTAAGCIAVPIPGPDYGYGPPAPVVVVPAPVYRGYRHGYYRGGYHRGWRHR